MSGASEPLASLLGRGHYLSYVYSYPHKTAYRPLQPGVDLREAWANEDRSALFLYLHVPFCEQRCDYCNLFSQALAPAATMAAYVAALERQAAVMAEVLAPARFARLAIGGGTPSHLGAALLDRLFDMAARMGATGIPTSVEVSPGTCDPETLRILVARKVTRVSVGVQSLVSDEVASVHRRQSLAQVEKVMAGIAGIAVRNVDLIYGLPGQTAQTWRASIERTIALGANEIYLYPLYVRPFTGMDPGATSPDHRVALYRAGRDQLLAAGFSQVSMRMFRLGASSESGPAYRCQTDGMVGLGAGARSYTRSLHYASPYAVTQANVRAQLATWVGQSDGDFGLARHGFRLDAAEQRRRYVILSLLEGRLDRGEYAARFGGDVLSHFPELGETVTAGLVEESRMALALTDLGRECSDVLGQWLQSSTVRALRAQWEPG